MKPIPLSSIQRILVTRIDRIGDVVLSTPVFTALKKRFPNARVYALVSPLTAEILEGHPAIDAIIVYDKKKKHKSLWHTLAFAHALRRERIDVVVNLHPSNRVHIISFASGIPLRIGYQKKMSFLLTHTIPEFKWQGLRHESEYNFDLLHFLDVKMPVTMDLVFPISEKEYQALDALLIRHELEKKSFVVFFPSASCPSRIWPLENVARLSHTLHERYGLKTVLVGSTDDKEIGIRLEALIPEKVVNFIGELSLKMMGALFTRACIVISNDSGPAHIAGAVNAPIVSIIGRSNPGLHPRRWKPLGAHSFYIHRENYCVSCKAHYCQKEFSCLRSITPEEVFTFIEKQMQVFLKKEM